MAIGDVYRVRAVCVANAQNGINISHWRVVAFAGSGGSDGQLAAVAEGIFAPLYKGVLSANAVWYGIDVQKILPLPIALAVPRTTLTGAGTAGAPMMPGQVAGLLRYTTGIAGRSGRGRSYIPFMSQASADAQGKVVAGYTTLLNALLAAFLTNMNYGTGGNTSQVAPCLLNKRTGATTLVTAGTSSGQFWSQRRREYGRRPDLLPF
jgi:hypothetical protein